MAIFRGTGETGTGSVSDFENLVEEAQAAAAEAEQSAIDAGLSAEDAQQAYEDTVAIYGSIAAVNAAVAAAQQAEVNAELAEANAEDAATAALVSQNAAAASALAAAEDAADAEAAANNPYVITVGSDLAGNGFAYDMGLITDVAVPNPGAAPGFIETVAVNIDDVIECADNIAAIIAAPTEAANAAASASDALDSANLAEDWANKTTGTVDGTEYSAKYYANQAATTLALSLLKANNLSDLTNAATARTNLGLGTAATTASTDYATAAQGTKADTSYSWGNHALAGYLTVETDPVYTASSWYTTTNNSTNWNTAYSWGNHALAGYADAGANSDITSLSGITGAISTVDSIQFDTTAGVTVGQGQMAWNADERTFDFGLNGVTLQVGQEQVVNVRNNTASTIPNGTVCMATGTLGASGRITVAPMDGTNAANAKYILGIATEDITAGSDGFVTTFGKIRNLNTSAWNDGDVLYTSTTTAGALTNVSPTSGLKQPIAFVIHAANNGTIFVRINPLNENLYLTSIPDGSITSSKLAATLDLGVLA